MALGPEDVSRFEQRARQVGDAIGWPLVFRVAPNPEYVGITAGPDSVFIIGPSKLTAIDIDLALDGLERGDQVVFADEDGDPRLGIPADPDAEASAIDPPPAAGDQPLDLQRIMDLVGDAMQGVMLGFHPEAAAANLIEARRPTLRELAAAHRENHEVHSGFTPEPLASLLSPSPVPEDILRLRRMIDDVLVAAERQLASSQGH